MGFFITFDLMISVCAFVVQNGMNALHLASKEGHVEVVRQLLVRGASVDSATKVNEEL